MYFNQESDTGKNSEHTHQVETSENIKSGVSSHSKLEESANER